MRSRLRLTVAGSLAVLLALVGASSFVVIRMAQAAIIEEVLRAETLAANERAAEVDAILVNGHNLLKSVVDRPNFVGALAREDVAAMQAALSGAIGQRGLRGAKIFGRDGALVATTGIPDQPHGAAIARLVTSVEGGGHMVTTFRLGELLPRVVAPLKGFAGTVSLVHVDGTVLASSASSPATRLQSPELISHLRTGGTVEYWSPLFKEHRIASVTPLIQQPWAIVVAAPAALAHRSAGTLVRDLAVVVSSTAILGAAVVGVLVLVLIRSRRLAESLHLEAEVQAFTDSLTGLANRRRLELAVAQAAETAKPVTLVLLDVDRFKVLNDGLGHVAGDEALCLVAASLSGAVRSDDLVARWGGDEFAVLLPGDEQTARSTVERIRDAVEAIEVPGFGALRSSVGMAVGPAELGVLLRDADRSLYEDKREAAVAATWL